MGQVGTSPPPTNIPGINGVPVALPLTMPRNVAASRGELPVPAGVLPTPARALLGKLLTGSE